MYRLHKHTDIINIVDRLDNMMGRIEATQDCYGESGKNEPRSVAQQAVLQHDWISLTVHVALSRANLNHQLTSVCFRSGTESCAACTMDCKIKCGKRSGYASDVPVDVQNFAKQQVASPLVLAHSRI
jgi:hypothetical protein